MFTKMKNIDLAFRHVKRFTMLLVACCVTLCCVVIYKCMEMVNKTQGRIYILAGGKALEAYAAEHKDNIPVEARDHVKTFHQLFFTLDPDDKAIEQSVSKALYLADASAKNTYDDLREKGYYAALISGNVNQTIVVDSVTVDVEEYPYHFRCVATQNITRPTSITSRMLITEGFLRSVSRSDNNPHGFLIEQWKTIENKDLTTSNRNL